MGIQHSSHTHPIPILMEIPLGIPIPTAALRFYRSKSQSSAFNEAGARGCQRRVPL